MNHTLSDIEKLKEAKILLEEGASDEKRMGISIIGNMIFSSTLISVLSFSSLYLGESGVTSGAMD